MKKLLSGLFLFSLVFLPSFSNAGLVLRSSVQSDGAALGYYQMQNKEAINFGGAYYKCSYSETNVCRYYLGNSNTGNPMQQNVLYCFDTAYSIACDYTSVIRFLNFSQDGILNQYTESQCKSVYGLIDDSECVGMDSITCQTTYNLIPISSVDQNYCMTNNLCPACSTCPTCPTNTGLSLTELYINNILHVGAPTILMNIPEEIDWDYAYTNGGNVMNIDVVGYNQDTEYINGLIDINNYKPTSEDFTNVFSNFSNFGGLLVAALFVILVFYFVKKMFK